MTSIKEKARNSIPEDMVFNILSKLPVKSLKRFKCVRKSWANLFENTQFMKLYRNNLLPNYDSNGNDSCFFLNQSMPNNFCSSNLLMLSDEMFRSKVKLEWPSPFPDNNLISIVGSFVNGMLCLCQGRDSGRAPEIGKKIVFWNPTTRDFKVIPPVSIHCPLGVTVSVGIHGFGYDLVTDDYKIIQCFHFVRGWSPQDDGPIIPKHLWQMYSLRSNSWRKIDCEISTRWSFDGVYLNGVCHWWGFKEVPVLVSFNLSDEVFHTTPIYYNDFYDMCRKSLMVLNYSVAMITMHESMTFFDISTLGEVGVKESWTKLFTIGPLPCGIARPIRVWKNGDMLLIRKKDNELVWFHSSTQLVEDLDVKVRRRCQLVR